MNSEGKSPETAHDTLDDAFFSGDPKADAQHAEAPPVHHDEPPVVARPSGAPVVSSAEDELSPAPDLAPDFDEDAVLGRKRGLHVGGFFLVLFGAIAGGAAGYFALRQSASKDAPVPAASASASAKAVAAPTSSTAVPVAAASADPSANAAKATTSSGRTSSKSGTSGFAGANPGVAPDTGGPADPALAKGELSAGEISGVVERNRPLIKRRCWQPEVAAQQGMGGSARVNASFTIGPSGNVERASASGAENDYPGLSSCIAARIREWKFPPSASSTPVNLPFVFAAQ